MSALIADFNSYISNQRAQRGYPVLASTMSTTPAYAGGLAQEDGAGNVAPATSATTNKIVGQFAKSWETNAPAPGLVLPVREGDVFLNLGASYSPSAANIGSTVYAADDNSVCMSATYPKAGILVALENGGAVVRVTLECT